MSIETHDPRDRLVREKYFSLRPKPLEQWLWQQSVPQAAERVFWLHWEEGMKAGNWCSEVPVKRVAVLCCVDPSTVTRAYQVLKSLGLIRRQDPGRDPNNPFQQATAVTEVRIPRELLTELGRFRNRRGQEPTRGVVGGEDFRAPLGSTQPPKAARIMSEGHPEASQTATEAPERSETAPARESASQGVWRPTRQEAQAMWSRASAAERSQFFAASRNGTSSIAFDSDTRLTPEDRGRLLLQLEQAARARNSPPPTHQSVQSAPASVSDAKPRHLSVLELARTRKQILATVPASETAEVLRQVVWAVEEGTLRRFDLPLAVNIALKKLREGAWTRPNRMPPNWVLPLARPEICSAA